MYKAMKLKYDYNDLEPYIDTKTVGLHYNNHYLSYVNNLNRLLDEETMNLISILQNTDQLDISIRDKVIYNIGGILNHELYFNNISPNKNNTPKGDLKIAIEEQFETFENFKQKFIDSAMELVGSGYTFLVLDKDKKLQIINMSNQDSPYLYGMIPLMTIDLWEHAYYLNYQNNKKQYIINFFEIVDFDYIESQYEENI